VKNSWPSERSPGVVVGMVTIDLQIWDRRQIQTPTSLPTARCRRTSCTVGSLSTDRVQSVEPQDLVHCEGRVRPHSRKSSLRLRVRLLRVLGDDGDRRLRRVAGGMSCGSDPRVRCGARFLSARMDADREEVMTVKLAGGGRARQGAGGRKCQRGVESRSRFGRGFRIESRLPTCLGYRAGAVGR